MTCSRSENYNVADQGLKGNFPGTTEGHRMERVGGLGGWLGSPSRKEFALYPTDSFAAWRLRGQIWVVVSV